MTAIQAGEARTVPHDRRHVVGLVMGIVGAQVALALAAVVGAASQVGGVDEGIGGIGPAWMRAWTTYDANWYIAIAREGYTTAPGTAFFPARMCSPRVGGMARGRCGDVVDAPGDGSPVSGVHN